MADNLTLNSGTGGADLATDEVSAGVHHQRVKVQHGADGSATDTSDAAPMPVKVEGYAAEDALATDNPVQVGGRYDATPRTLDDGDVGAVAMDADGSVWIADGGNSITVDGTVTANAGSGPWPITDNSGSITVDDGAGSLTVDGAVTVSGTVTANVGTGTQAVSGTVTANAGTGPFPVSDNGGSLTVDGAVTATLSATDNAVLDAIEADTTTIAGAVAAGQMQVDIVTGTVTANLSAVDNAVLDNIEIDTSTLSGAVLGSEMQVDVVAPLPAGTNNIGDVDIASIPGVATEGAALGSGMLMQGDDGTDRTNVLVDTAGRLQVDIVSGGSSSTQYTEDDASAGGETGTVMLGVRKDSDTSPVTADGDFHTPIFDALGNLKVNVKAGAAAGGTSTTDDSTFTAGSGSGTPMMGFVTTDVVNTGDVGVVGMDVNRSLKVSIETDNVGIGGGTQYTEDAASAANPIGSQLIARRRDSLSGETTADGDVVALNSTNNGELYVKHADSVAVTGTITANAGTGTRTVSGTVTANLGATDNAVLDSIVTNTTGLAGAISGGQVQADIVAALPAGTNNIGDVDVASVPAPLNVTGGGTEASALRVTLANDSTGVVTVDGTVDLGATDNAVLDAIEVDTTSIASSATTIAGAVTGNEMQVDVLTMPSTTVTATQLDVDDLSATADTVSAALDTSRIMDGTTALTPKFAVINVAASGNNTLVALVAGKKIRVLSGVLMSAGTVNVRFESGAGTAQLTGIIPLVANTGFQIPPCPWGNFETASGALLNLELSAAIDVDGWITYVEV